MRPMNNTLRELSLKEVSAVAQNTRSQYGERITKLEEATIDNNSVVEKAITKLTEEIKKLKLRIEQLESKHPKSPEDDSTRVPKFDITSEDREKLITFYRENKEDITSFEKSIFAAVIKYQTASEKQLNIITQTKKDMARRKTNQSVDELFN